KTAKFGPFGVKFSKGGPGNVKKKVSLILKICVFQIALGERRNFCERSTPCISSGSRASSKKLPNFGPLREIIDPSFFCFAYHCPLKRVGPVFCHVSVLPTTVLSKQSVHVLPRRRNFSHQVFCLPLSSQNSWSSGFATSTQLFTSGVLPTTVLSKQSVQC